MPRNLVPGATFTWSSEASNVATVSGTGTVTAIVAGSTIVSATSGGVQGCSDGHGHARAAAYRLSDTGNDDRWRECDVQRNRLDANGNVRPTPAVTWTSSNTAVATVSSNGVATE
ncbi:MAG: Ig-like domain-containing protein [Gemmatimonadetes bacterium]|nr:Ig-like domain-containing protein [Gemmatimonadota bacterium]